VSAVEQNEANVRGRRAKSLAAWGLLAGGVSFFVGGSLHPGEDPPGLTLKEHLLLLYEDSSWYPSHALLLVGMVLIAASLVALVRAKTLASAPRAHTASVIAAFAAVLGAAASLLHLVAATEADKIAAGERTPLTDVSLVIETVINPAVGLSIAALALIGALTRTIGYRLTAVFGVVGGVAYALAGGTVLLTDKLNFLFPFSAGIAVWAVAAAIRLLLNARANTTAGSRVAYTTRGTVG
jgi:hypothetical protein